MTDLDLSNAVIIHIYGTYEDGVIWGGPTHYWPDFFFPGSYLEPAVTYTVTITWDPESSHDGGGRAFWLTPITVGSEVDDYDGPVLPFGNIYNGSGNTADSVTFDIGPGIAGWDDPVYGPGGSGGYDGIWFETDHFGALSAISIDPAFDVVTPLTAVASDTGRRRFW